MAELEQRFCRLITAELVIQTDALARLIRDQTIEENKRHRTFIELDKIIIRHTIRIYNQGIAAAGREKFQTLYFCFFLAVAGRDNDVLSGAS